MYVRWPHIHSSFVNRWYSKQTIHVWLLFFSLWLKEQFAEHLLAVLNFHCFANWNIVSYENVEEVIILTIRYGINKYYINYNNVIINTETLLSCNIWKNEKNILYIPPWYRFTYPHFAQLFVLWIYKFIFDLAYQQFKKNESHLWVLCTHSKFHFIRPVYLMGLSNPWSICSNCTAAP